MIAGRFVGANNWVIHCNDEKNTMKKKTRYRFNHSLTTVMLYGLEALVVTSKQKQALETWDAEMNPSSATKNS